MTTTQVTAQERSCFYSLPHFLCIYSKCAGPQQLLDAGSHWLQSPVACLFREQGLAGDVATLVVCIQENVAPLAI